MNQPLTFLFICEHGAAKSIVAAAYFNKLASEMNLNVCPIALGTTPNSEISRKAVEGLPRDGLTPTESKPKNLAVSIQRWDGVPPVSEDYEKARGAIVERLTRLINSI